MLRLKRIRWAQFSLAGLLVAVSVVGLILAPIVNRVQRQQRVVKAVAELGGRALFFEDEQQLATRRGVLLGWLGDDYFRTVRSIDLQGTAAGDGLVAELARLSRLEALNLCDTKITDDSLRHIEQLTSLKALDLGFNKITNDALPHLHPLRELVYLNLDVTLVTDNGLPVLQSLPKLHRLQLYNTKISDSGAEVLCKFPALGELDVADTLLTNAGVAHLARLPGLTRLRLDECSASDGSELRINDGCLEHVTNMPNLLEISLMQLNVSSEGLNRLQQARPALAIRR